MIYLVLCVSAAIIIDLKTFKKISADIYSNIFKEFYISFNIVLIFALFSLAISEEKEFILQLFYFLFFIPMYIIKRRQFMCKIDDRNMQDSNLFLVSDACAVSVYWMLSVFLAMIMFKIAGRVFPPFMTQIEMIMLSSIISSSVAFVVIYKASRNFPGKSFLSRLGVRKPRFSKAKIILMPILLGLFFSFISSLLIVTRQIQPETPFGDMMENVATMSGAFMFLAAAMLTAPFVEEIIFRGYFFYVLKRVKGRAFAVVAIVLAFAFMHVDQYWGDWTAIIMVTLLGLVMTLLRAFSGSVIPSIIMHYVYNSGVLIFSVIFVVLQNPYYFEYVTNSNNYSVEHNIHLLKKSIKEDPKFTDAYNELAVLYSSNKDTLDIALSLINKALFYHPERAVYLDTKAMILKKLNRINEVLNIQRKLKESNPRYKIGDYQQKNNNK